MAKDSSRKLLFATLATLLFLACTEAVARIAKTVEQDLRESSSGGFSAWSIPSPTLGWHKRPGYRGEAGEYMRHFDQHGYLAVDSHQVADTTQKKIVFIGDSNTFGAGAPTEASFVEVVDRLVPGAAAINLGVPGYTSYQGTLVLTEYLQRLRPHLLVVSFNFNDRRYVLPGDPPDGPKRFALLHAARRGAAASVLAAQDTSYFVRALRRVAQLGGFIPRPAASRSVPVDTLRPRVDEAAYRRNLTAIALRAREHSLPLIFVLLKDSPLHAYHLTEGMRLLATSRSQAMNHLLFAASSGKEFADLARLQMVHAYRSQGDHERAAEVAATTTIPDSDGGWPIRLDEDYNEVMRQVAQDHGVELVDGGAAVAEHPSDYVDLCHFNAAAHRRVGELLAARIVPILEGGANAGLTPRTEER